MPPPVKEEPMSQPPPVSPQGGVAPMLPIFVDGVEVLEEVVDGVDVLEEGWGWWARETTPPRSRDSSPARGGWAQPSPPRDSSPPRGGAAPSAASAVVIGLEPRPRFTMGSKEEMAELFEREGSPFGPAMQELYLEARASSAEQQETFRIEMAAAQTRQEKRTVERERPQDNMNFLLQTIGDHLVDVETGEVDRKGLNDMAIHIRGIGLRTRVGPEDQWKRDWLGKHIRVYKALADDIGFTLMVPI
jgi:hypothetical protein